MIPMVAYAAAQPVGAARLELQEGTAFASLWGDSTLLEHRGRGIFCALGAPGRDREGARLPLPAGPRMETSLAALRAARLPGRGDDHAVHPAWITSSLIPSGSRKKTA